MLNSGRLLRYRASSVTYGKTQSATGAVKLTEIIGKEFRYARQTMKEQRLMLGKAETVSGTMIIVCRLSPITSEMTHYRLSSGELYRIDSKIEYQDSRILEITAVRVMK